MAIDGNWKVSLATPVGERTAILTLNTDGAKLSGKMDSADLGVAEFADGKVDGNTLQWVIQVKKPMPMSVKFSATIAGDSITGNAALGMFGSAKMTGQRA